MKAIQQLAIGVATMAVLSGTSHAAGSTGKRLIMDINVTESGNVSLLGNTAWGNPDSCARSDQIWIESSATTYNVNLAQAMTALAAGKQMDAWVSGCFAWGGSSYPAVKALHLRGN